MDAKLDRLSGDGGLAEVLQDEALDRRTPMWGEC